MRRGHRRAWQALFGYAPANGPCLSLIGPSTRPPGSSTPTPSLPHPVRGQVNESNGIRESSLVCCCGLNQWSPKVRALSISSSLFQSITFLDGLSRQHKLIPWWQTSSPSTRFRKALPVFQPYFRPNLAEIGLLER